MLNNAFPWSGGGGGNRPTQHHHHHQPRREWNNPSTREGDRPHQNRTNFQDDKKQKLQVYFPLNIDSRFSCWRDFPSNPLATPMPPMVQEVPRFHRQPHPPTMSYDKPRRELPAANPEDYPFFCQPCQRGFYSEEKYTAHRDTHLYCDVPGCHFTCRSHKAYKMEEHKDLLHNRPDAPNLEDTSKYLEQRKRRFPTSENVQSKVEELYYKAARGCVLPDERRRWMRSHGIVIRKRPRSEMAYIVSGSLDHGEEEGSNTEDPSAVGHAPGEKTKGEEADSTSSFSGDEERSGSDGESDLSSSIRSEGAPPPAQPEAPRQGSAAPDERAQRPLPRKTKLVPMGPNGTLTKRQKVQLIREKYAESKQVPQFYVCQRCGKKGDHWVADCPTKGNAVFDRHLVWGEAKLEHKSNRAPQEEDAGPTGEAVEPEAQDSAPAQSEEGTRDEEAEVPERDDVPEQTEQPPEEVTAHRDSEGEKIFTKTVAPVAARKMNHPPRHPNTRHMPHKETLYEKLTEEDRMNERGLLLQAIRFFVNRNFFLPEQN
ncbi:zinc finger protein [Angomonas deanei]|uniref:Zinc knuckle, putative n=1 Tax=Angomonas deanei TaxID=59799 RepID=A0A7G2C2A7_9TRYP|nr:zinc finger protein [Angomonas deanei]CAD2213384.1 Zinc knuckle, putative [Angomonas deanei]|eukprot:EPY23337.1 zinc finger protein [Angomonas deanei]